MNSRMSSTLADVRCSLLEGDSSTKRRRDMISAIDCASALLHHQPSQLPADITLLRDQLAPIHHVQAGISPKRLKNIKADLAAAIRTHDKVHANPRSVVERTPAWSSFISSVKQPWQRHQLARLADYCSSRGVKPDAVNDEILAQFSGHLSDESLAKDPDKTRTKTIRTWNHLIRRAGLPYALLTVPKKERYQAIPLSHYPLSFQADLDAWIARLSHVDLFADEGPKKALRPHSLRNVRATVRQFAAALVARGRPIVSIQSLATLVEYEAFKEGLRFFIERKGGRVPTWLWGMASALIAIARYHLKLADDEIDALSKIKSRLKTNTDRMTEKNRDRLAQFEDLYNVELLMLLPSRLVAAAQKSAVPSSRVGLKVMHAVAIEILLACPMRMGNLASIDIERHFRWSGTGNNQTISLYVPEAEVKNGIAIEADLPRETANLIRLYLKSYRDLVSTSPGTWLFPMATDACHRNAGHLSEEIARTIYRETGLRVNGHLFRPLSGKLYLERRPSGHETVRQFLRHKKIDTTTTYYTGLDSKRAQQLYYDEVLSGRNRKGSKDK